MTITIKNLTDEYNQLLGYKAALEEMKDSKSKNNISRSVNNIPNVKITDINHFSAYDLAKYKKIIFTETSIKELEKRY